jgi:hypothetical protein
METDRQMYLNQIACALDPLRSGPKGEKVRTLGFKNFLTRMADPSIEFLQETLVALSQDFNIRRKLFDLTYEANTNPDFFSNRGIKIDESEGIYTGIANTSTLLSFVSSGSREDAEIIFGEIQERKIRLAKHDEEMKPLLEFDGLLSPILQDAEGLKDESDYKIRSERASQIQRRLVDFAKANGVKFYYDQKQKEEVEPSLRAIRKASWNYDVLIGNWHHDPWDFQKAVGLTNAAVGRYRVEQAIGEISVDPDVINRLRLEYGAKAANLITLEGIIERINDRVGSMIHFKIEIPKFKVVPVDLYRKWMQGELTDEDVMPFFEWMRKSKVGSEWYLEDDYIVRSSAVFSEDGETMTGAGIYDSIVVTAGQGFEEFKTAVETVYASTNSEKARSYRNANGVRDEKMGLIIQTYSHRLDPGYVNSSLPGVPELMEIRTPGGRNFINREKLDAFLAVQPDDELVREIFHFQPDHHKVAETTLHALGEIAMVLEKVWGRSVQIEFAGVGSFIDILQVRALPQSEKKEAINFPDMPFVWRTSSIGVGDLTLEVLSGFLSHYGRTGLAVYDSNHEKSVYGVDLPESGAVAICNSQGNNGHIQTLCAEANLICLYPDEYSIPYQTLTELKKVRVVSNGIEGRIYDVSE